MNQEEKMNNYYISENEILHIVTGDDGILYLSCDIYCDGKFNRVDFQINGDKLNLFYIDTEIEESEDIYYKLNKNNVIINGNEISIELECTFKCNDNYSFKIEFNKKFNLDNISSSRYDIFDKLDNKFCLWYIKKIIKTKQLYSEYDFIYENASGILKFIDIAVKKRIEFQLDDKNVEYTMEDCIKDSQTFLDDFNIKINIQDLFNDGSIIITDGFDRKYVNGTSGYDKENNKKLIYLHKTNNLLMTIVLVHELIHYYNQPSDNNRTIPSHFLTECISYAYELIFLDRYLSGKYESDAQDMYKQAINSLRWTAFLIYAPVVSLKLFKDNTFTIEELEKRGNIENYFTEMKNFINERRTISKELWNMMGYYLGIYCYIEYKKNHMFSDKILELNYSVNTKTFMDCLKIIDLNGIGDVFTKGRENLEEYAKFINSFEENKELIEPSL